MSSDRVTCPDPRAGPAGVVTTHGRRWSGRVAAVAWALLLACPALGRAEDPAILDTRHTLLARQVLQDDPLLAPLNLGVRVRHGVAILWGPVPSLELGRRAAARLQCLPELAAVRNELFLDPWAEPTPDAQAVATPPLPLRPQEGQAPAAPTPAATAQRSPGRPFVPTPWNLARPPTSPTAGGTASPKRAEALTVLPAVRVPIPTAGTTDKSRSDIEPQVRQLQQGQERFRRVRVEVRGEQVFLSGAVPSWRDLHELAGAITRIPGVAGVTIRAIRTDPPSH